MDIRKSYPEGTKRKLRQLLSGTVVMYSDATCMLLRDFHDGKRKLVELSSGCILWGRCLVWKQTVKIVLIDS